MSSIQESAFLAGSGVQASAMLFAIKGTLIVVAFLWAVWIAMGSYRAWHRGDLEIYDLLWQVMRSSIVILIIGFYIQ